MTQATGASGLLFGNPSAGELSPADAGPIVIPTAPAKAKRAPAKATKRAAVKKATPAAEAPAPAPAKAPVPAEVPAISVKEAEAAARWIYDTARSLHAGETKLNETRGATFDDAVARGRALGLSEATITANVTAAKLRTDRIPAAPPAPPAPAPSTPAVAVGS